MTEEKAGLATHMALGLALGTPSKGVRIMSKFQIEVQQKGEGPPYRFKVEVKEGASASEHGVTLGESTYQELTAGRTSPEQCVRLAFQFLLAREPKESILSDFDVTVIDRYFPEFRKEFARLR